MASESVRSQSKITLIQYPGVHRNKTLSPPCAKAHMGLAFKGLEYEIKNVYSPGEAKRHNPRGRVPVLIVDGERVVDSTDILSTLDRRFPEPPLEPTEPGAQAAVKILEDWADEVLYFYGVYTRWCLPENYERMKSRILSRLKIPARWIAPLVARRTVVRRAAGQGIGVKEPKTIVREIDDCLKALDGMLPGESWLVGDRLTRADIAVCAVLDQWRVESLTPELAARVNRHPKIVSWIDRVHQLAPNAAE